MKATEIYDVARAWRPLAYEPSWLSYEPTLDLSITDKTDRDDVEFGDLKYELKKWSESAHALSIQTSRMLQSCQDAIKAEVFEDPGDETIDTLEATQRHFTQSHKRIIKLSEAVYNLSSQIPHILELREYLSGLDEKYRIVITNLQELRWAILIEEGNRTPKAGHVFTRGADFVNAIEEQ